jgi:ABC-type sugar transport system permease subunit/ABC-type glycerol-3-phosphate transport system substrate-binding protein
MRKHLFSCALLLGLITARGMADPVTLRYATTDGAESLGIVKGIVHRFEQAHPNIHIKIEPIVDNFANKVLSMCAANLAPDISRMGFGNYEGFAERGILMPLDDFVKKSPDVNLNRFYPNAVQMCTLGGKLYNLPRAIQPYVMVYYNKRLFREAGLAYPDKNWTWDFVPHPEEGSRSFTYLLDKLSKVRPDGRRQYGYATAWPQLWFETLLTSRNYTIWDDDKHPTNLRATDPAVVQLFSFAADAVNKKKWIPSNSEISTNNSSVHDEFVKGRLAMFQSGSWECMKLRDQMTDDWDVTVFPAYRGNHRYSIVDGNGTVIFSSTKYPQECWEFVKWMSGPEGMKSLAQAGLDQPAIRELAMQPGIWLPGPNSPEKARVPANQIVTDEAAASMVLHITPSYFTDIRNAIQGTEYTVLTGIGEPKEKLQDLQEKQTKALQFALVRKKRDPYPSYGALLVGVAIALVGIGWVYLPERDRKFTNRQKKQSRSAYWFLLPWIGGLGMTLGPMIYSFLLSFAESDIVSPPKWAGLDNYIDAFDFSRNDNTLVSLKVTAFYAALSIPLGLIVALGLALLLNQKVKGIPLWRAIYYIPSLAGGVAVSLIWAKVFNPDSGLINSLIYGPDGKRNLFGLGSLLSHLAGTPDQPINWLNNPHTVLPSFIIMGLWGAGGGTLFFLANLQGISPMYYEAATIDGATTVQKFKSVTLPMLTPTLFFTLVTGVIGALQAFTQAYILTDGGPDRATYFYMLYLYKEAFGNLHMGFASALAWILFVIILVLTVLQLKGSKRWVYYEGELK